MSRRLSAQGCPQVHRRDLSKNPTACGPCGQPCHLIPNTVAALSANPSAVPTAIAAPPRPKAVAVATPSQPPAVAEHAKFRASPLARRVAEEAGLDLNEIQGRWPRRAHHQTRRR